MSSSVVHVAEDRVRQLLDWRRTFDAVEASMRSVSEGRASQKPRTFTMVRKSNTVLLTMPGHLEDDSYGALACKLVTAAEGNEKRAPPLPNILANIMLFDEETGQMKAIIAGTEITTWRTAAASAVATKHLHGDKKKDVLAIFGAGVQGKSHAVAFQHFFKFKEVRIWNHTSTKGSKLVDELNSSSALKEFKSFNSVEECSKDADVIVTATSSPKPFLKVAWIKPGTHINAVGAGAGHHHSELEEAVYRSSDIFIDHWDGAKDELSGLLEAGIKFKGEIGEVIQGKLSAAGPQRTTVFQSLGMAVEDCAMARMIYDLHTKK